MKIVKEKDFDPNFVPVCPHCEKDLETVVRLEDMKGFLEGHYGYCYACPHCRKVLGFADYAS